MLFLPIELLQIITFLLPAAYLAPVCKRLRDMYDERWYRYKLESSLSGTARQDIWPYPSYRAVYDRYLQNYPIHEFSAEEPLSEYVGTGVKIANSLEGIMVLNFNGDLFVGKKQVLKRRQVVDIARDTCITRKEWINIVTIKDSDEEFISATTRACLSTKHLWLLAKRAIVKIPFRNGRKVIRLRNNFIVLAQDGSLHSCYEKGIYENQGYLADNRTQVIRTSKQYLVPVVTSELVKDINEEYVLETVTGKICTFTIACFGEDCVLRLQYQLSRYNVASISNVVIECRDRYYDVILSGRSVVVIDSHCYDFDDNLYPVRLHRTDRDFYVSLSSRPIVRWPLEPNKLQNGNREVVVLLYLIALLYGDKGYSRGKVYRTAAESLEKYPLIITSGKELNGVTGITPTITKEIDQYLKHGKIDRLEKLLNESKLCRC